MFHSACVGSVVQVSFFLIQGHFFIVGLMVGMGDRPLVHTGVSWTALTLSVNPIILTEKWNECCGDAIAGLLAGIFESQKIGRRKPQRLCKGTTEDSMLSTSQSKWQWYIVWHLHSLKIQCLAVRRINNHHSMSEFSECNNVVALLHRR